MFFYLIFPRFKFIFWITGAGEPELVGNRIVPNSAELTAMTIVSKETSDSSSSVSEPPVPPRENADIKKAQPEAAEPKSSDTIRTKVPKAQSRKPNRVRQSRIESMLSKAELARRANLSVLTVDRIEKGFGCRMNTKRKILEALGLSLADRVRVFGEEE